MVTREKKQQTDDEGKERESLKPSISQGTPKILPVAKKI